MCPTVKKSQFKSVQKTIPPPPFKLNGCSLTEMIRSLHCFPHVKKCQPPYTLGEQCCCKERWVLMFIIFTLHGKDIVICIKLVL